MKKYINFLLTSSMLVTFCTGQLDVDDLGARIQSHVKESLRPLDNLGARIQADVNKKLAGLDNLGEKIEKEVYNGLEPVRIMESTMKVRYGTDGTTVANFIPGGRQLIVRNGEYYDCDGVINENNGDCSGNLRKFQLDRKEDFCFVTSKNVINDWYCIAPNNSFKTISYVNGEIICETQDNSPKLLIKVKEFENMCRNVASSVNYKYFTNTPLVHIGNGLTCSGNSPQVCSYTESLTSNGYFDVFVNV